MNPFVLETKISFCMTVECRRHTNFYTVRESNPCPQGNLCNSSKGHDHYAVVGRPLIEL